MVTFRSRKACQFYLERLGFLKVDEETYKCYGAEKDFLAVISYTLINGWTITFS